MIVTPSTTEHRPPGTPTNSGTPRHLTASVALLAALALVVLPQLYGALVLEPAAASEFETDSVGLVQTAFGVAYAVGFIAWGPLVDRYGARHMLLLGLSCLAIITAAIAGAPTMPWLILGRIAQGLTAASFAPAAFSYLGIHFRMPLRTTAITVLTSSFLAASTLGQVAAQVITEALSWRWFFGISAILLAIGVGIGARLLQTDQVPTYTPPQPFVALVALIRDHRVIILLVATLAILGPFIAIYATFEENDQYAGRAVLALRLSALPALVWAGFASRWLARFRSTSRITVGFAGAAVASLLLALTGSSSIAAAASMFVFAACVSLLAPAMIQALTSLAPDQPGGITALYTFALFLGASLAPLAASIAASSAQFNVLPPISLASIAILLAAAALTTIAGSAAPVAQAPASATKTTPE